jgi:hypothetical protein
MLKMNEYYIENLYNKVYYFKKLNYTIRYRVCVFFLNNKTYKKILKINL